MNVPLSLPQYFSIGFALIVLGRAIHYVAVTRYLRERGIAITRAGSLIPDWKEWAAYRKTRLSDHRPLTWWYVLWAIQVILFFWVVGWLATGVGGVKIAIPSHLAQAASDAGDYVTVFDVTQSGYRQWSFAAFGLIFVAVGLAIPTLIRLGIFESNLHGWRSGFLASSLGLRFSGRPRAFSPRTLTTGVQSTRCALSRRTSSKAR